MTRDDFRQKCRAAGIGDDKPLFLVLETLFDTAATARDAVQAGARGLTREGEADLVKRIARQADASMRDVAVKHRLRLERKTALIAGMVAAACLLLGGCGGYWFGWSSGRQSVETTERQIAMAFRWAGRRRHLAAPDAQQRPRKALDHCSGSAVWSDNGRQACSIPFWIDGPGAP